MTVNQNISIYGGPFLSSYITTVLTSSGLLGGLTEGLSVRQDCHRTSIPSQKQTLIWCYASFADGVPTLIQHGLSTLFFTGSPPTSGISWALRADWCLAIGKTNQLNKNKSENANPRKLCDWLHESFVVAIFAILTPPPPPLISPARFAVISWLFVEVENGDILFSRHRELIE